jgi:hypothetical protein
MHYRYYDYYPSFEVDEDTSPNDNPYLDRISIFKLNDLEILGESVSDGWSQLIDVHESKAIFSVGGGVLLMDINDPSAIQPQAFLPIQGWLPKLTIEGDYIYAASGRYGVFSLEMEQSNLLPPL